MTYSALFTFTKRAMRGIGRSNLATSRPLLGQSVMECSPTPRASSERKGERFRDFMYQLCF